MVVASSPTATASVDTPTAAAEAAGQRRQHRPVQPVEAELVDVVDRQRGLGDVAGDHAVGTHLGEVTDPAQLPVGDPWRAPRATGDLLASLRAQASAWRLKAPTPAGKDTTWRHNGKSTAYEAGIELSNCRVYSGSGLVESGDKQDNGDSREGALGQRRPCLVRRRS